MKKRFAGIVAAAAGGLLLMAAVPMWAHHSFAGEYDIDKPVKLEGTVKKVESINPHSWITIDDEKTGGGNVGN